MAVGAEGGPYSSVPATSGTHWVTPGQWGVYTAANPAIEYQMVHNLEHGGIVIWYQPGQLDAAGISALENWVRQQQQTTRYKAIVSPVDRAGLRPSDRGHRLGLAPLPRQPPTSAPSRSSSTTATESHPNRTASDLQPGPLRLTPAVRVRHHRRGRLAQRQSK